MPGSILSVLNVCTIVFNLWNNHSEYITIPLYRGNCCLEKFSNLPKSTQLVSGRIQAQAVYSATPLSSLLTDKKKV